MARIVIAILIGVSSCSISYAQVKAYVTNNTLSRVTVIDTSNDTVITNVTVGTAPEAPGITPDVSKVYVPNGNNTISVIDTSNNTVSATITNLDITTNYKGVIVKPGTGSNRAYATDYQNGKVSVIDTTINTIIATITVGTNPRYPAIKPDGTRLYVPNEGSGTVSVIDTSTNTVTATVTVGSLPEQAAVTPNGSFVYVTNLASAAVSKINTSTNTVVNTIGVGVGPGGLDITPAGNSVYVANLIDGTVSVISTSTDTVTNTIAVGGGRTGVAVTPDGAKVYVANFNMGNVSVIRTATNTVTTTISLGAGSGPFGIAMPKPYPTAVRLSEFKATAFNGEVTLEWATASEVMNHGFNIYRSESQQEGYVKINTALIPAAGKITGGYYYFWDRSVKNGTQYYYKLEDVDINGGSTMHGPVRLQTQSGFGLAQNFEITSSPAQNPVLSPSDYPRSSTPPSSSPSDRLKQFSIAGQNAVKIQIRRAGMYKITWEDLNQLGFSTNFDPRNLQLYVGGREQAIRVVGEEDGSFDPGDYIEFYGIGQDNKYTNSRTYWLIVGDRPGRRMMRDGPVAFVPIRIPSELLKEVDELGSKERTIHLQSLRRAIRNGDLLRQDAFKELALNSSEEKPVKESKEGAPSNHTGRTGETSVLRTPVASSANEGASAPEPDTTKSEDMHSPIVRETTFDTDTTTSQAQEQPPVVRTVGIPSEPKAANSERTPPEREFNSEEQISAEGEDFVDAASDLPMAGPMLINVVPSAEQDQNSTPKSTNQNNNSKQAPSSTPDQGQQLPKGSTGSPGQSKEPPKIITGFTESMEFKERNNYFPSLQNGEENEKFFGALVFNDPVTESFILTGIQMTMPAGLEVWLQGGTDDYSVRPNHHYKIYLNNTFLQDVWFSGFESYHRNVSISSDLLREGENRLTIVPQRDTGAQVDAVFFDRLRVNYPRNLQADQDRLMFSAETDGTYSISGFSNSAVEIYDTTDEENVRMLPALTINPTDTGYAVTFNGEAERAYVVTTRSAVLRAAETGLNRPSDLTSSDNAADYLIITHSNFMNAAQSLASYRQGQGLRVQVVTIENIYDEFSFGNQDPHAIRDFLMFAYDHWSISPRQVLLFGDATYDYRNYLGSTFQNYVPTRLIESQSQDVIIETASDIWFVPSGQANNFLMQIGRLSVQNTSEAQAVVEKIVAYESARTSARKVLVVADRGDIFPFESVAAEITNLIPADYQVLDLYASQKSPSEIRNTIINEINRNEAFLINYNGHGSVMEWASEIFTNSDVGQLSNTNLPIMVAFNCLNGYFQNTYTDSLSEALVNVGQKGAIAFWAGTSLTNPGCQKDMNLRLTELIFDNAVNTLGTATIEATNSLVGRPECAEVTRTWVLFGDPALRIR